MKRSTAALLSAVVILLGGALRLHQLEAAGGRYTPHIDREEGYYEAGLSQLSCHSLALISNPVPSDYLAPVFPSFLALSEAAFDRPSPYHARAAKTLLSTLAVATACLLGWLLFSPLAGVFAGALLAFNVSDILDVAGLNLHGFYGGALLALGASLVLWLERRDVRRACLLGLMLAATLLCRPAHFPFPLLLAAACLWRWRFPEGRWRALLPVAAAAALFLAPMAARNGLQFGRYWPFDLKGSAVLVSAATGVYEATTMEHALDAAESIEPGFKARGLEGRPLHTELIRVAAGRIMREPWAYAGYCLQRLFLYWKGLWFYLALGAYALWRRRADRPLEALVLTAASLSGYAFAGGAPQYHAAAVPLLCVIAGAGLASLPLMGTARPEPAPVLRRLRAGVCVLPGAFVVVYAGMLVFLSLELRDHFRSGPNGPMLSDPCPDGRALDALKLASMQAGDRGKAAVLYVGQANRALYYRKQERRPAEERGLRAVLSGMLERNPADAGLWLDRAELETRTGERDAALRSLARVEAMKPLAAEPRRRLAGLYWELKEHRRALASVDLLLARSPRDAQLLRDRAELRRADRLSRERAYPASKTQPQPPSQAAAPTPPLQARPQAWSWLERANREARAGERAAALASLARAQASDPDDDGLRRMALLYRQLDEDGRALALLKPLLERLPGDAGLWLERAELEARRNEKAAALRSLARAEAVDPGNAARKDEQRRRVALDYQSLGEHGKAIAVLDGLILQNPGEGSFYGDRGLCEHLKGDSDAAVRDLEKAIALDPKLIPAYLTLGAVHAAKGRRARALAVYDDGLARNPESAAAPLRGALVDARNGILSKEAR